MAMAVKGILVHWRALVVLLVPLLLLPLPLTYSDSLAPASIARDMLPGTAFTVLISRANIKMEEITSCADSNAVEARASYCVIVLAVFWVTEVVPLPVTSLLPVVLFPILGVLSTEEVCISYLKETNMMFVGGLIVAIAVEHCNLHKRIALRAMILIGASPRRLMLGFMLPTMFLSMWISNTATTAMMAPIVSAVLDELKTQEVENGRRPSVMGGATSRHDSGTFDHETRRKSLARVDINKLARPTDEAVCYFLGVAYAANIGGTGTLTGTATNLTFKGLYESLFPRMHDVNFANWMIFNVLLMLINVFIAWVWLQILFMGLFRKGGNKLKQSKDQRKAVEEVIASKYKELGPMTYHEGSVLFLFVLVVVLWFFRAPEFIPGWAEFVSSKKIKDATPAMLIVFLLFVLPADLDFLSRWKSNGPPKASPALLNWKIVHEKLPWGLVLLIGGGFAMAAASRESGLSHLVGSNLVSLQDTLPPTAILIVVCVATTFLTEVSSNTAIANIVLPVLAEMASAMRIHPLYFMMPATLCCSYAFMFPVATPSNAIVMAASNMRPGDMMKAGIGMNILCLLCLFLLFPTLGTFIYDLGHFPPEAAHLGD